MEDGVPCQGSIDDILGQCRHNDCIHWYLWAISCGADVRPARAPALQSLSNAGNKTFARLHICTMRRILPVILKN